MRQNPETLKAVEAMHAALTADVLKMPSEVRQILIREARFHRQGSQSLEDLLRRPSSLPVVLAAGAASFAEKVFRTAVSQGENS